MEQNECLRRLLEIITEINDIESASAVLQWDQETNMPDDGAESRAQQLATLEKIAHQKLISDETGRLLETLVPWAGELPYDSPAAGLIRSIHRRYGRMTRVPPVLVARMAKAKSRALAAWIRAKETSRYELFQPHLEELVALSIERADAQGFRPSRYDGMLDEFEPGSKTNDVVRIYDTLKPVLVDLVPEATEGSRADDDHFLYSEYPLDAQWAFAREILATIGFDSRKGRLDESHHPFTMGIAPSDVRLTVRFSRNDLAQGLFAIIHEAGHGLYEQGIPEELWRQGLGGVQSAGVHESQSLLWENLVGRSQEFWQAFFPSLQRHFPGNLGHVTGEAFFRSINKVKPSLIRVDADEVTYNLHILIRFELERLMFEGRVDFSDLPEMWNQRMQDYLGITPPDAASGILQDIHWADGLFGYFPSYTLGHLLAVQFFSQALQEMPDLRQNIARGQFMLLLNWLREKIHMHGSIFTMNELVPRVTGSAPDPEPYIRYIRGKYSRK